jgi:hypothetical protein
VAGGSLTSGHGSCATAGTQDHGYGRTGDHRSGEASLCSRNEHQWSSLSKVRGPSDIFLEKIVSERILFFRKFIFETDTPKKARTDSMDSAQGNGLALPVVSKRGRANAKRRGVRVPGTCTMRCKRLEFFQQSKPLLGRAPERTGWVRSCFRAELLYG